MQEVYLELIRGFLNDESKFKVFKQQKQYAAVIGQPEIHQAIAFLNHCQKNHPDIWANLSKFQEADKIGSPTLYKICGVNISLNLCRYINTVCLLKENFGSLDDWNIHEIGVGWGGLYHCIVSQWKSDGYAFIDHNEAGELARKHSMALGNDDVKRHNSIYYGEPNLAIAEYSITEQDEAGVMELTDRYLIPARNVFIRCNLIDNSLKAKWITHLRSKFHITIQDEEPNTCRFNCIVIGKSE